ncbi:uncharacterized protein LOC6609709 [Drosophila sechellia]|uniref:GM19940 n=1 Tax=Drosophila sechellia TaxID=7238 RepID=B4HN97_DROSE|nr:uncharacterized protein LOC6609709 [Drosophila sechellia]EDW48379.1 GM19940 [Drosophila sechellia]
MDMKPKTAEFWMVIFLYLLPNWKLEAEAKNNFELQTDNFTCSSDDISSSVLKEFTCGISKSAKRRTWHMEFVLEQPVAEHDFIMKIILPRRRPLPDFVLLNVTTDGCQLLANRNQVPLMRLGRNIMERFSNFPKQCPFKPSFTYYIRGFRLDLNLLPAVDMETPFHFRRLKPFSFLQKLFLYGLRIEIELLLFSFFHLVSV